jgi:hypothetical protein
MEHQEAGAATLSLHFMYQWKSLQFGLSAGTDNLLDNEVVRWRYQGSVWMSVGIGVVLFVDNEIKTPGTNR